MSEDKKSDKLDTSPEMEWFFRWIMPVLVPISIFLTVLVLTNLYPKFMEELFGP